jgi:hypothetical protein
MGEYSVHKLPSPFSREKENSNLNLFSEPCSNTSYPQVLLNMYSSASEFGVLPENNSGDLSSSELIWVILGIAILPGQLQYPKRSASYNNKNNGSDDQIGIH